MRMTANEGHQTVHTSAVMRDRSEHLKGGDCCTVVLQCIHSLN